MTIWMEGTSIRSSIIRLPMRSVWQAMEENLPGPFHYFGISDLAMIDDGPQKSKKLTSEDFNRLTSDERVRHIISQAQYYG